MKPMFSPSLMCMDFADIRHQFEVLNTRADLYHCDLMDGHYVPNLALSPDFIKAVSKIATLPLDCHLMVTNPGDYIDPLAEAGAGYICPHVETINADAFRIIKKIKDAGCKVGVVINPSTPLSCIQYYIHQLDKITIMSVDPGFAGQPFIREMLDKVREAKELKEKNGYQYIIEIDGSCNANTYKDMTDAGVECFIVGSSGLFNLNPDLETAWDMMTKTYTEKTGIQL